MVVACQILLDNIICFPIILTESTRRPDADQVSPLGIRRKVTEFGSCPPQPSLGQGGFSPCRWRSVGRNGARAKSRILPPRQAPRRGGTQLGAGTPHDGPDVDERTLHPDGEATRDAEDRPDHLDDEEGKAGELLVAADPVQVSLDLADAAPRRLGDPRDTEQARTQGRRQVQDQEDGKDGTIAVLRGDDELMEVVAPPTDDDACDLDDEDGRQPGQQSSQRRQRPPRRRPSCVTQQVTRFLAPFPLLIVARSSRDVTAASTGCAAFATFSDVAAVLLS